jgi:hypothetical protein
MLSLRLMHIFNDFKAKMLITATCNSYSCTCLGRLGWLGRYNKNRNDPISVAPPKVVKASTIETVACHCHQRYRANLRKWKQCFNVIVKRCKY